MFNWKYTPLLAVLLVSAPAFAKGPGGGMSSGGPAVSHSTANSNGPSAADRDTGAARAEDRMSAQGKANTNGPSAADRDKGLDRAKDRAKHPKSVQAKAKAKTNANGPNALDRDKGVGRAEDRMSTEGAKR
jgi:hypothetical protein